MDAPVLPVDQVRLDDVEPAGGKGAKLGEFAVARAERRVILEAARR